MTPLLRFDIAWTDPPGDDHEAGAALAWGPGILYVADVPVWFVRSVDAPEPVAWSWIDLLEFLDLSKLLKGYFYTNLVATLGRALSVLRHDDGDRLPPVAAVDAEIALHKDPCRPGRELGA